MHEYDRSSKWLLEHHGASLLRLAGVADVESCRAVAADVVQPRQLPDGLLEVHLRRAETADLFIVEIASYPERRVIEQVMRDAVMVWLDRKALPEVVTLVLHPKGTYRVPVTEMLTSPLRWTELRMNWRVVELWSLPAEAVLTIGDWESVPWAPLMDFQGPPEPFLTQCRQIIDQRAPAEERANLLAVTQVLMGLRYNDPKLFAIFGGSQGMIESPLIQEIVDQAKSDGMRSMILRFLAARFGAAPSDVAAALQTIADQKRLNELADYAARCPDLEAFRSRLAS